MSLFFHFAWRFGIENDGDFCVVSFCGLRFPGNRARKVLKKIGGENLEGNSGESSER